MERPITEHIKENREPLTLEEYEKVGGYQALRKAVTMQAQDVTKIVTDSGLQGRGGAGFSTGRKWSYIPLGEDAPRPKYFVANADEMEPGTFKDRLLLVSHPHEVLEGTILGAYATQADEAWVFLRWAYRDAAKSMSKAIAEAYEAGYLGKNILGSGFDLDLRLHISAGRYICGEATALLNALEGQRAIPRFKPPHAAASGLWGKPTVVNNVETLSYVPYILIKGSDWFKGLSLTDDPGTKLIQVTGRVRTPGVWELPMGIPVRQIIDDNAGGMLPEHKLVGFLPGGASTRFLLAEHLETPMDFPSMQKAGSRFGTATMVVLDDKTCPVGMVENVMRFFARESCGWCTPCRDGLPWVEKLLHAIEQGEGKPEDLEMLDHAVKVITEDTCFCDLAPGAMQPLSSALEFFRSDFQRHIELGKCPWR